MEQGIFRCAPAFLVAIFCCSAQAIQINEIRIDQPSTDNEEYFELVGDPGESLDGLSYLVIGDSPEGGSGVVEMVISLEGLSIPDDGFFLAAEQTFSLHGAIPDLVTSLNFENSDNLTHLLVSGVDEDVVMVDLDLDLLPDDGILDTMPWGEIMDGIGLIESADLSASASEYFYGSSLGFVDVGPSAGFVPSHVLRSGDANSSWVMGEFEPGANDTPGASNTGEPPPPMPTCDFNFDDMCDIDDLDMLMDIGDLQAGVENGFQDFYDLNGDDRVDGQDVEEWLILAADKNGFSTLYLLGDANLDGTVDAQDLNAVGLNWLGTDKVWSDGDFNGDGIVNAEDLNQLGLNWLQSAPMPAPSAVPEPTTLVILAQLGLIIGLGLRRRHP